MLSISYKKTSKGYEIYFNDELAIVQDFYPDGKPDVIIKASEREPLAIEKAKLIVKELQLADGEYEIKLKS